MLMEERENRDRRDAGVKRLRRAARKRYPKRNDSVIDCSRSRKHRSSDNANKPTTLPRSGPRPNAQPTDRKSTRLNSSHVEISYAVFCLKKKKKQQDKQRKKKR